MLNQPKTKTCRSPRTDHQPIHARLPLNAGVAPRFGSEYVGDEPTHRRGALATLLYNIPAGETNASFELQICSRIASDTTSDTIVINNVNSIPLALPPCMATAAPIVRQISTLWLVVESWDHLPSTLADFQCTNCRFRKGDASVSSTDGWDSDGNVSWSEIFSRLPNLSRLFLRSSSLPASLPSTLPDKLAIFDLSQCGITGTIPSTLFPSASNARRNVVLLGNQLTGTLPANILLPLLQNPTLRYFSLDLSNNQLSGRFPTGIFDPLASANLIAFSVRLDGNRAFAGTIPQNLFATSVTWASNTFEFNIANTNMSGVVPVGLFSRLTTVATVKFIASGTQITGPLPIYLFSPDFKPTELLEIDLSSSKLTGTIPSGFLSELIWTNQTFSQLHVHLQNNDLEGTIPPNLLWHEVSTTKKDSRSASESDSTMESQALLRASWRVIFRLTLNLARNRLSGTIPSDLFSQTFVLTQFQNPSAQVRAIADFSDNLLTGSITTQFLHSFAPACITASILVGNNQLSGSLPTTAGLNPTFRASIYSLHLQNNEFNGTFPSSWNNPSDGMMGTIDISGNEITGSIPSGLLNSFSLQYFTATNTSLVGHIPALGSNLKTLAISNTDIDVCSTQSVAAVANYALPNTCEVSVPRSCDCYTAYSPCFPALPSLCGIPPPVTPVAPVTSPIAIAPEAVPAAPEAVPTVPESAPTIPESVPTVPEVPEFQPSEPSPDAAIPIPSLPPNSTNPTPPLDIEPQESPFAPVNSTEPTAPPVDPPTSSSTYHVASVMLLTYVMAAWALTF